MSERWLECTSCVGFKCLTCDGTGLAGDALSYLTLEYEKDWAINHPETQSFSFQGLGLPAAEEMRGDDTKAMDAAIEAVTKHERRSITNGI